MPPVAGMCKAWMPMFYSMGNGTCKEFIYGGCGGNENRFQTKDLCEKECGDKGYIFHPIIYTKSIFGYIIF